MYWRWVCSRMAARAAVLVGACAIAAQPTPEGLLASWAFLAVGHLLTVWLIPLRDESDS